VTRIYAHVFVSDGRAEEIYVPRYRSYLVFAPLLVPLHFYIETNGHMDFRSPSFRRAFAIAGFIGIRLLYSFASLDPSCMVRSLSCLFQHRVVWLTISLYYNVPIFLSCFILFLSSSRSSSHAWSVSHLLAVPNPHIVLVIQLPIIASVLVFTQSILFA
jgi:hypothetical protein